MEWGWDNVRALIGIILIYGIAYGFSENKRAFPWRIVIGATVIQAALALILFGVPLIRSGLFQANLVVDSLISATAYGTSFVFGPVFGTQAGWEGLTGQPGPIFAVHLLPLIIVIAALSAVLWHWHLLRWVTKSFAVVFSRLLGLG
ncbi:MAG: Na+ dependent nucleoside transporter N-terminal domain-containing protein, partial [Henriciella sp.]